MDYCLVRFIFCFLCFTSAVYYTGDEPNVVSYYMCVVGNPVVFNKNTSFLFLCESRQSTRELRNLHDFTFLLAARSVDYKCQTCTERALFFRVFLSSTKRATFFFRVRLRSSEKRKIAFEGKEHFSEG